VLSIPLLLGSVTGSEFWRMCLLLLNTLVFSLAVGLVISSVGLEERQVMLGSFFALLLLAFGFPALWRLGTYASNNRWLDVFLLFPSPSYAFRMCTDASIRYASGEFWRSMLTMAMLSVACIGSASLILPRVFIERGRSAAGSRLSENLRRWRFGLRTADDKVRAARLRDCRPFFWLSYRDRLPRIMVWGCMVVGAGFAIFMYHAIAGGNRTFVPVTFLTLFGFHLAFKFFCACDSCRRFSEDRRSGNMELILATPLSVNAILAAQASALRRLFTGPLLMLMALNLIWMQAHFSLRRGGNDDDIIVMGLGGAVIAIMDLWALRWMGMWMGIRSSTYKRAVMATFGRVMLPLWIPVILFMFAGMTGAIRSSGAVKGFFIIWFIASAIYDAMQVTWAQVRLRREFRRAAASDYREVRQIPRTLARPPILSMAPQ
jgi:ABC-type transport system involved in cytochrome c biogenesis permease component